MDYSFRDGLLNMRLDSKTLTMSVFVHEAAQRECKAVGEKMAPRIM